MPKTGKGLRRYLLIALVLFCIGTASFVAIACFVPGWLSQFSWAPQHGVAVQPGSLYGVPDRRAAAVLSGGGDRREAAAVRQSPGCGERPSRPAGAAAQMICEA